MQVSKKEKETLSRAIDQWKAMGLISESTAEQLEQSAKIKPFNWQSLAYYSFMLAIASLIIAIVSILADKALLDLIDSLISTSYLKKSIFFLALSTLLFWFDYIYNQKTNRKTYSKGIFLFFAAVFLSLSTGLLSFHFNMEENAGSLFLLLALVYFTLAIVRTKELLWLFGIITLVISFGMITHDMGKENHLFVGMNFPMRFTILGALILLIAFYTRKVRKVTSFYLPTYWSGLLIFFLSLWFLSIFGNYSTYTQWLEVRQYYLWWYSLLLLLACVFAIVIGIKKEDQHLKNIGVSFIFLNLYTRYFEYFWDELHKAVFFTVIAISFWIIGKKAEKIWHKSKK